MIACPWWMDRYMQVGGCGGDRVGSGGGMCEGEQYVRIVGQREGIVRALSAAYEGDTVLLAGKKYE
ncbi:MAG TPA: hypothetical protein VF040_13155 [Ktedonobacterales bacterium]